jgi:hypothetical protein
MVAAVFGVLPGAPAVADETLSVKMTLENDTFSPSEIKVPANTPFILRVLNGNREAAEIESADMKFEKVAPAFTAVILRVRPLKPGRYVLYNEYRQDVARATIVAE